ncbi:MAG TPA: protein kinase, partial [Pirellulales bacterium]|nr:protein kinase [Pirellulales bacterium]
MSEPNPPRPETYADLQREKVCDRFEAQWRARNRPKLEEFLSLAPAADDSALFAELLALELSYRADRGERPTREEYRDRFPRHHGAIAAAFDRFSSLPAGNRVVNEPPRSTDAARRREPVDAQEEGPGSTVGPYKLLQRLGEGGMGTVYLAEQDHPVRRRVAIKVIKAGMDSGQVIARFEQERQALAMMDHPNIARVLDAGATEQGRPYFVMELVKGIPLTRYCDQEHLTPRERLELFIPVCQAVQHAHQKGIIHRDLKPSNVLIALYDGRAVPKIIDFGVAKATLQKLTERTMFTEVGSIVGTLEYMAPEQAELNNLDVDTRADVYSLGVLLYELLAGSPPFTREQLRGAAFVEMLRLIREVEPPKPSTRLSSSTELASIAAKRQLEPQRLKRLIHGDLDWIVMKCLEKERGRRYETASGLASDLARHLADEPVLAGPPSSLYRVRKFSRKHRVALATALAFAIVLVLATGVSVWQAVLARSSERAALEQRAIADTARLQEGQARKLAEDRLARAKRAEASAKRNESLAQENAKQATRSAEQATLSAEQARQAGQAADEARQQAEANDRESRAQLAQQYTVVGTQLMEQGDLLAALPWLAGALHVDPREGNAQAMHRRRFESAWRHSPRLLRVWFHDKPVRAVYFCPGDERVLTLADPRGGRPGDTYLWGITSDEPQFTWPANQVGRTGYGRFSPDGHFLTGYSSVDLTTGLVTALPFLPNPRPERQSPSGAWGL